MMINSINLNHLRIFECVCRTKSMTLAAQELHLTQSGVTQHIQSLEGVLELKLFDRIHKRLVPTAKAKILFERCKESFDGIESALASVRKQDKNLTGCINIGMPMEFGNNVILPYLSQFSQKHAGIRFNIKYGFAGELCRDLVNGDLDFSFLDGLGIDKKLSTRTIYDEEILLCSSIGYLKKRGFLREKREFFETLDYVDYQSDEPFLRLWFLHHYGIKRAKLNVKATMMNVQGVGRFIQDGSAVGILPSHLFDKMMQNGIKLHSFKGSGSPLRNQIQITYLKERALSRAASAVFAWLIEKLEAPSASI